MTETIESLTASARRSVAAARMAADEPWQDDSGRDIYWLRDEACAIRDRLYARVEYDRWKREHWLTWRWRTYSAPALPRKYPGRIQ